MNHFKKYLILVGSVFGIISSAQSSSSQTSQEKTPSSNQPATRPVVRYTDCCDCHGCDGLFKPNLFDSWFGHHSLTVDTIPAEGGIAEQRDIVGFIPADGGSPDCWDLFFGALNNLVCTPSTGGDLCGGGDCSGCGNCNF